MSTATETGIVQINLNPAPITIEPSTGLGELLTRVERFITIPPNGMSATQLKTLQKEKRARAVAEVAKAFPVTDDPSCETAGGFVAECAAIAGGIVDRWKSAKKKAHEAHADVCRMEAEELEAKSIIREAIDGNINIYRVAQKQEQRRKEIAEAEAAAAEGRRLQKIADDAAAEQRKIEAAAAEARRQGEISKARELTQQAAAVAEQVVDTQEQAQLAAEVYHEPASTPKVAGRVEKWPWVGKCVSIEDLISAVAKADFPLYHEIPTRGGGVERVALFEVNQAVINYYAKRLEGNAKIPGCVFEETLNSSYRTK